MKKEWMAGQMSEQRSMGYGTLSRSYQLQKYDPSLIEDSGMARILSISVPWQIHKVDIWQVCKVIVIIMLVIHHFLNLMLPVNSWVWNSWYRFNTAACPYRHNSHHKVYKVVFFPFSGINHLSVCTIHVFTTYFLVSLYCFLNNQRIFRSFS